MSRLSWPPELASGSAVLRVLGALLLLAGIGVLASNENALQNYRQAAQRHGGEFLDLGRTAAAPNVGMYGYMVRVAGSPRVVVPPRDAEFNQSTATPVLIRHVEVFQWREVHVGSDVHYELDWVDHPVDSMHFLHPAGHANPSRFPLEGRQFDAGQVQVGGFTLSKILVHALPGSARLTPDMQALPHNLAASFSLYQDYLVSSARPGDPRLGDVRVSWEIVPLQLVTLVARLDGDRLVPASNAPDGKGYQVQLGDRPLVDIFPDLPLPPEFSLPHRLMALLLAVLGALALLWDRRQRLSDLLLPLGMAGMLIGSIAGVMWLGGDNALAGNWFGLAGIGLLLSGWPLWLRYRRGAADLHH